MNHNLISIIVPIYNAENYLEKSISSILSQTYQNLQIILVDDGSVDSSLAVCRKYALLDKRIEIIHQENGGVVAARKTGICAAKGEMISWVDADDWIEPDWIESLVNIWTDTKADIVSAAHFHDIGEDRIKVENKLPEGIYRKKDILPQMIYNGNFFEYGIQPHLYTKLIRREILLKTQMNVNNQIIAGDDAAVVYPSILEADRICVSGLCGYHYVQHSGSITKTGYSDEKIRVNALIDYLSNVFAERKVLSVMYGQLKAYKKYLLALRQISALDEFILAPFGGIAYGSRIVIYGAGVLGQKIYRYIKDSGKAEVCAWLDRNWKVYRENGFEVDAPERIMELDGKYDDVIIANITQKTAMSMREYIKALGVKEEKIRWFSESFLCMAMYDEAGGE